MYNPDLPDQAISDGLGRQEPLDITLQELLALPTSEIPKYGQRPTAEELRTRSQLYYQDVHVGMELPKYVYQLTPAHLMRWSAAIEDWNPIHYDLDFAVNHDRLPGISVQRSWKRSVVPQFLKDWALPGGWLWKASCQHRTLSMPGDLLIVWGTVTGVQEIQQIGLVELETGMKNRYGTESMPGTATVVLPLRGGPPIPYPFVPPPDERQPEQAADAETPFSLDREGSSDTNVLGA